MSLSLFPGGQGTRAKADGFHFIHASFYPRLRLHLCQLLSRRSLHMPTTAYTYTAAHASGEKLYYLSITYTAVNYARLNGSTSHRPGGAVSRCFRLIVNPLSADWSLELG